MYYILRGNDNNIPAYRLDSPSPKGYARVPWFDGKPRRRPPQAALQFDLDPQSGVLMPDFFNVDMPLFSPRLFTALTDAGVSNMESYPVVLRDPSTGQTWKDYRAINILGVLSIAETEDLTVEGAGSGRFLMDPGTLAVDYDRCHGLSCFRPCENLSIILVHENVASRIRLSDFLGLTLEKLARISHRLRGFSLDP